MQITKIEMMDKHKCRVYLNDEPAFWLYHSEAEELHLREGMDFSSRRQAEIEENVLKKRARLQCMTLLQQMEPDRAAASPADAPEGVSGECD